MFFMDVPSKAVSSHEATQPRSHEGVRKTTALFFVAPWLRRSVAFYAVSRAKLKPTFRRRARRSGVAVQPDDEKVHETPVERHHEAAGHREPRGPKPPI